MHWTCDKSSVALPAHTHPMPNKRHCRRIGNRLLTHCCRNSRTMPHSHSLRVFINGAWIIWIYLFALHSRLECVDAKIGLYFFFFFYLVWIWYQIYCWYSIVGTTWIHINSPVCLFPPLILLSLSCFRTCRSPTLLLADTTHCYLYSICLAHFDF